MRELQFSGYSDDTFGLVNDIGIDYDNCASMKPIVFKVCRESEPHVGLFVFGQYAVCPGGTWVIGVTQLDEDFPLPNWITCIDQNEDCPYSPLLTMVVPDDVVVEHVRASHER